MHLPSHIANLNLLSATPSPSPFLNLYSSSSAPSPALHGGNNGVTGGGMEDPLLEESLRQHLDLWINTEFEWTEESSLTSSNVNKDETALVTPGGSGTKGKEDD